jgi:hypothetical protein
MYPVSDDRDLQVRLGLELLLAVGKATRLPSATTCMPPLMQLGAFTNVCRRTYTYSIRTVFLPETAHLRLVVGVG